MTEDDEFDMGWGHFHAHLLRGSGIRRIVTMTHLDSPGFRQRHASRIDPNQIFDELIRFRLRWANVGPWRRRAVWLVLILLALFVFPGAVGAVATAQHQAASAGSASEVDGLSWMNIKDSSGIPLANYLFASDHGGPLNPGATIVWAVVGLEFIGYLAIVTTAIWLIGYALSFRWLDMFSSALRGVADALTGQVATPLVLVTAAAIGAFFVAWFIVRGYHAKAAMQVVTMLGVAIVGPVFLSEPLEDVLSSHGLLAQGRDLGISVAAGLNGNGNPNPNQLVATMQGNLADNFARRPLQVWNFGHVVDERPACRSVWSAGVLAGDDDRVKNGMKACGDTAAHAKAANPSMGQIGTGLMLLVCGGILLLFAAYLGIKVIKAALDTIYHGFMSIFGFAAGGFVYGPSQTFLVRNLVDSFIAAARMTAYTIFLGVYLLFMGNLFQQARGQVIAVIVIAGAVEIIAISQLKRLSQSLTSGNDWIANRFALAVQGGQVKSASSSGAALGMGTSHAASSGRGLVAGLAALNTINSSPVSAWLAAGTTNPLNPQARGRRRIDLANVEIAPMRRESHTWGQLARTNWRVLAVEAAADFGGMHTELGVANALKRLEDSKIPDAQLPGALMSAGGSREHVGNAIRALSTQKSTTSQNQNSFKPLQKAVAAARAVENHVDDDARRAFAAQAVVAANSFARNTSAPPPGAPIDHRFIETVEQNWHSDRALRAAITPDEWNGVGRATRWEIGQRVARMHRDAAHAYHADQSELNRARLMESTRRISNLDHMDPGGGLDPWDP
ncbi:hypothetical protein AB4305_17065 [Nocardia sp. 2YAB30]|uniref:hypothetical protein n=1 Tax=unclassified Nocardia TaxID=2637762 RepID=UPI003F98E88D